MEPDDQSGRVQQDEQADAPSAAETVAPFQAAVSRTDTRFKVGNQHALKHGLFAAKPEAVLPADLQDDLEAFEAAILSDLGGADELSTIERGYVDKLRTVEALCKLALLNIHKNGFTSKSESMLLQAIDRWDKVASRLGTKRRTKDIAHMSIGEYLIHQREQPLLTKEPTT